MGRKINFLPTKVKYNTKDKTISLFYRKKNTKKLFKATIPFDHYIFLSDTYRKYGNTDVIYKHLYTGKPLIKAYLDPREAYNIYKENKYEHAEADVSPEQRFMCDSFYDVEFPSNILPRIFFLDIETYVMDGNLPSFKHNIADINAITIYDNYTEKFYCWFLLNDDTVKKSKTTRKEVEKTIKEYGEAELYFFDSPKSLLESFVNFLIKNVPDIITAWNIKFDIPYICRKIIDYLGLDTLKKISPFNYVSSKITYALDNNENLELTSIIPGIDIIDMLTLYKKYSSSEKPSYALKYIAEEELGESKLVNGADDDEFMDTSELYIKDFVKFCKYNIQDVRLLVMLEDKLKILNLAVTIRNIAKIDFQDIFFETRIIDNILLMEAVKRREHDNWLYALPSKPLHSEKAKYLGAYVKPPIKGLFKWVSDLDFKSLYPSIVKTFMISTETLVGIVNCYQQIVAYTLAKNFNIDDLNKIKEDLLPKYLQYDFRLLKDIEQTGGKIDLNEIDKKPLDIEVEYYDLYKNKKYPRSFNNLKEFRKWLKEKNFCMLPNGLIVDQNKDDAIIAKIIADIMESREKYKKLMFVNLKKGNHDLYNVYNIYQTAVKIVNNSVYGATASERFRMFNIKISEGITTSGQLIIRSSTKILNDFLNSKCNTEGKDFAITNDTDSIIFTLQDLVKYPPSTRDPKILEEISNVSKECQDFINKSMIWLCKNCFYKTNVNTYNNYLIIKNEWLADTGIFVAKKAYAIHIIFNEGVPIDKLKFVGISLKRSSTPKAFKPFLEKVLTSILQLKDKEYIDTLIVEECDKLKNEYDVSDIALPISVNNIDSYTKNLPVHIRGARLWNEYFAVKKSDRIQSGKVKYVYVKSWNPEILNELNKNKEYVISVPDGNNYWELVKKNIVVDYDKMKERLIIKPVKAFYDALNWNLPFEALSNNSGVFNKLARNSKKNNIRKSKLKLI